LFEKETKGSFAGYLNTWPGLIETVTKNMADKGQMFQILTTMIQARTERTQVTITGYHIGWLPHRM